MTKAYSKIALRQPKKNWPSIITSALSGTGGGIVLGGSFWGPVGAILGAVAGTIVSGMAELRREERFQKN